MWWSHKALLWIDKSVGSFDFQLLDFKICVWYNRSIFLTLYDNAVEIVTHTCACQHQLLYLKYNEEKQGVCLVFYIQLFVTFWRTFYG